MKNHEMTPDNKLPPIWNWVVTIHVILVAAPLALFTFLILTAPGPNIGAGLVGSVVMVLGLPWTLPVFWKRRPGE